MPRDCSELMPLGAGGGEADGGHGAAEEGAHPAFGVWRGSGYEGAPLVLKISTARAPGRAEVTEGWDPDGPEEVPLHDLREGGVFRWGRCTWKRTGDLIAAVDFPEIFYFKAPPEARFEEERRTWDTQKGASERRWGRLGRQCLASGYVRRVGLVASLLALANTCLVNPTVRDALAPNISTLLANKRGADTLLAISAAQAVLVPAAHAWDSWWTRCRPGLFGTLGQANAGCFQKDKWVHLTNVLVWAVCSAFLCLVITTPLCLKPEYREADLPEGHCSDQGHMWSTIGLFFVPLLGLAWSYLWGHGRAGRGGLVNLVKYVELLSALVLLAFQLLCGPASAQGGWLALIALELELVAVGLLLLGGCFRLADEWAMNLALTGTAVLMLGMPANALYRLGFDLWG